jgi:hypothetical protein
MIVTRSGTVSSRPSEKQNKEDSRVKCNLCDLYFSTKWNMWRHRRTFHGCKEDDVHDCKTSGCGERFVATASRRKNLQHEKPQQAIDRSGVREWASSPSVRKTKFSHQATVVGTRTVVEERRTEKKRHRRGVGAQFDCAICGKVLKSVAWFTRHVKVVHERDDV